MDRQELQEFRRVLTGRGRSVLRRRGRALAEEEELLAERDRGTYGGCVVCHAPIDEERLHAVPETDRCAGCADRH